MVSSKFIEESAVINLQKRLNVLGPSVSPINISSEDREPSFDGFIELFENPSKGTDGYMKLPVQVKGESVNLFSKFSRTFNVRKVDLENYYKEGTVVFFVVELDMVRDNCEIFYNVINPFKADAELRKIKKKGQKTTRMSFYPFPQDDEEARRALFLAQAQKTQQGWIGIDAFKHPHKNEFTLFAPVNLLEALSGDSTGIYIDSDAAVVSMNLKSEDGRPLPIPVGELFIVPPVAESTWKQHDMSISVDGHEYYSSLQEKVVGNRATLRIGQSLSLELIKQSDEAVKITASICIRGNILQRMHDIDFIEAASSSDQYINLNGHEFISLTEFGMRFHDARLNACRVFLGQVKAILEKVGVDALSLDVNSLEKVDQEKIEHIYESLIHGKPFKTKEKLSPGRRIVRFGNLNLDLCLLAENYRLSGSSDDNGQYVLCDSYRIHEFQRVIMKQSVSTLNGIQDVYYDTNIYTQIEPHDLARISNLHLNEIVADYQRIIGMAECQQTDVDLAKNCIFEDANNVALRLLQSYDELTDSNSESNITGSLADDRLDAAIRLENWLLNQNLSLKNMYLINQYQGLKRKRALTENECRELATIKAESTGSMNKLACSLLLDQQSEAEVYFTKLSPADQKMFRAYPISHFWAPEQGKTKAVVKQIAMANQGVVTTRAIEDFDIRRSAVKEMQEKGELRQISTGIYQLPDSVNDTYFLAELKFSKGIFSQCSALYLLGLLEEDPGPMVMAFPNSYNPTQVKKSGIIVRQETPRIFGQGKTEVNTPYDHPVVVYSKERTLCDILRPRNHVDTQYVTEAFRKYKQSAEIDATGLRRFGAMLNVSPRLSAIIDYW